MRPEESLDMGNQGYSVAFDVQKNALEIQLHVGVLRTRHMLRTTEDVQVKILRTDGSSRIVPAGKNKSPDPEELLFDVPLQPGEEQAKIIVQQGTASAVLLNFEAPAHVWDNAISGVKGYFGLLLTEYADRF